MLDFSSVISILLPDSQNDVVSMEDANGNVLWERGGGENYAREPMFFENTTSTDGTVGFKKYNSNAPSIEVFTSTDKRTWTSVGTTSTNTITATLPANGRLYIRATANRWGTSTSYYNQISVDVDCTVNGNILSLLYGENFKNYTELPNYTYIFESLFENNSSISSVQNLILPSNTRNYCYDYIFYNCTALTTAPDLPATTLSPYCYNHMFQNCSRLATVPSTLPATTLVSGCYRGMFQGCTLLTTAPSLPATTLVNGCYEGMFSGCSSLNHIEVGFTQWNDSATTNWVNGVPDKNDGLFPEEVSFVCPDTLPEDYGVNRVPSPFWRMTRSENEYFYVENINGSAINVWIYREVQSATYTSTTRSVTAPAVTFEYSYDKSTWNTYTSSTSETNKISVPDGGRVYFRGNNSKLINCDFYKNSTNKCYFNLRASNLMRTDGYFNVGGNISSLVNSSATSFADGFTVPIGALFNSNTNLKHASRLNINAIGNDNGTAAYTSNPVIYSIFSGCTSLVTPPTLPSTTLNQIGARKTSNSITDFMDPEAAYYRMFRACSSLIYTPKLPATTLKNSCYSNMFYGCTSLTKAPDLPATTLVGSTWDYRDGTSSYGSVTHGCYESLFNGCTGLNYIKAMFTTTPGTSYTSNWVKNVAASGTFVQNDYATWNVTGVNGIPTGWTVSSNRTIPLYIEDASGAANTLSICKGYTDAPTISVEISTDNNTWTSLGSTSTTALTYTIPANGRVYLRATANQWATSASNHNYINCSNSFNVGGNIMSLLDKTSFATKTSFGSYQYVFERLFGANIVNGCKVVSAEKLLLPATTITYECYGSMFRASHLKYAPTMLPATTLQNYCYAYMFADCASLETVPELPATTLATQCYGYMFYNCKALTTAPALSATTMATLCYGNMFRGCTSLETAPVLPATSLGSNTSCYQMMFYGCSKLNYIKAMFTTTPGTSYTSNWVNGVAATGTFVKNSSATWNVTGTNGIPSGWTVQTA